MGVRLAAGGGVALIVVLLVTVLSQNVEQSLGSNSTVRISGVALEVPAGLQLCQRETVPSGAARIRVFAGVEGRGGPLRVRILRSGGEASTGRSTAIMGEGPVDLALEPPVERELLGAKVCFENQGLTSVRLAGNRTPALASPANPFSARLGDDPRIDYFAAERSSRLGLAGRVVERLPLLKAGFLGGWAIWALAALLCVGWVLTFSLIRSLRS